MSVPSAHHWNQDGPIGIDAEVGPPESAVVLPVRRAGVDGNAPVPQPQSVTTRDGTRPAAAFPRTGARLRSARPVSRACPGRRGTDDITS